MNHFPPLSFTEINVFDKILFCIVLLLSCIMIIKYVKANIQQKKNDQMIKHYLTIKNDKYDQIIDILTNPNDITASELKNSIEVDLTKIDKRFKEILKGDLNKIKKTHQVNPWNMDLISRILN